MSLTCDVLFFNGFPNKYVFRKEGKTIQEKLNDEINMNQDIESNLIEKSKRLEAYTNSSKQLEDLVSSKREDIKKLQINIREV